MLISTIVSLVVGLVVLIIGSITDIRTREVPDWLNFGFLAFVLMSSLIASIYHGYFHILLNTLLGLVVGVIIGLLMFYTGQWGGGDSKLIFGLSALIGFSFSELSQGNIPLLLMFIINLMLVGAVYGILFSLFKAFTNFSVFKVEAVKKMRSKKIIILRVVLMLFVIISFIYMLISRSVGSIMIFSFSMLLLLFVYLWLLVSCVEKACMIKEIPLKELTEGDWVIKDVFKGKKKLLKSLRTGVTMNDIKMLRKNNIKKVLIKIGIPFVPSFLLAYIITFVFKNWILVFF